MMLFGTYVYGLLVHILNIKRMLDLNLTYNSLINPKHPSHGSSEVLIQIHYWQLNLFLEVPSLLHLHGGLHCWTF